MAAKKTKRDPVVEAHTRRLLAWARVMRQFGALRDELAAIVADDEFTEPAREARELILEAEDCIALAVPRR